MPHGLRVLLRSARFGRCVLLCVALCFALFAPQTAHAGKEEAVELLAKGDKKLASGDRAMEQGEVEEALSLYDEALALYQNAYREFPSPKIYFPIAAAEQKLGRYLDAMHHYEQMLRESKDPSKELIAEVDAAIAQVRKNLVALDLVVEQDGALVVVDGKELGLTPLAGPYYMAPGEHTYVVSLDGHKSFKETIDLPPGDVATRRTELEALPKGTASSGHDDGLRSKRLVLTASFGGAGVLLAGAAFSAIQTKAKYDRFDDQSLSLEQREAARDSGKTYQLATDILLVGGLLAAGYGTYYYYTSYKGSVSKEKGQAARSEKSPGSVWLSPYAAPNQAGVALGGLF